MKVLHVVATQQRRGAEVFAATLIGALQGSGVEQCVAIVRSQVDPGLRFGVPEVYLTGPHRRYNRRLDLTGVEKLRSSLRDLDPDVIHAHGGEALKYALAATRGRGERIVYRRIGEVWGPSSVRWRRWAHGRLIRRASRVVAVAEVVRSELLQMYGLSEDRVVAIPNAVDGATIRPIAGREETRRRFGIAHEEVVVLSLGALTWEKDPIAHIEIVAGAFDSLTGLVHLVVGDGPLRDRVEGEARRRRPARTIILGSREDVADILAASDVLLLASRTEGMPACVIEAGMAGRPVVAYALAGVPEVVVDGQTGLLARPGDADSLTEKLAVVLANEHQRVEMGRAAAERCRTRFDIKAVSGSYLNVYEAVVRGIARPTTPSPHDLPAA